MGKKIKYPEPGAQAGGNNDLYGVAVTLVLCVFVVFFASSGLDLDKFHAAAAGLGIALRGEAPATAPASSPDTTSGEDITAPTTAAPPQTTSAEARIAEQLDSFARQIHLFLIYTGLEGEVEPDYENVTLAIRLADSMFFDEGDARLITEAYGHLNTVVDLLVEYSHIIGKVRVEGHTDSVPISGSLYSDNWELSGIRAARAAKYMLQTGRIPADSLYYAGFGELRPVADSGTEQGRQANRRLELVLEELDLQALALHDEN